MAWQSSLSGRSGQPPPKRQRPLSSGSQAFLTCNHEDDLVAAFRRELEAKYSPTYEFYLACPFAKHNPAHYENVKNVCTEGWGFKNIGKLKEHINRVHTRSHGCHKCKQRFTSLTEMQKHADKSCEERELTDEDPEWMTVAQTEAWAGLDCRGRGETRRTSQKESRADSQRDKAATAAAAAHKWKAMIYACLFPHVDENERPSAFHKPGLVTVNFVIEFLTRHERGPRLSDPSHHGGDMSLAAAGLQAGPAYHPVGGNANSTANSTPMTGHFPLEHGWQKPELAAAGVSYSQPTTAYATDGSLDFGDGREEDMAAMNPAFRQHAAAAAAPVQTGPQTPRLTRGVLKSHASSLPPPPFPFHVSHGPDSGYRSREQEGEAAAADAAAAHKADEDAAGIIPADDLMWPHGGLEPDLMRFFQSEEFMSMQMRGEHLELSDAEADED